MRMPLPRKISRLLFLFLVLPMIHGLPVGLAEEKSAPDFFEMLMTNAYPGVYGEALDLFSKKYGNTGSDFLKTVSSDLDQYQLHINKIASFIDEEGKAGTKEYDEKEISAAIAGIKELGQTPDGKIFLGVYGLSPDSVNEVVALFQIWRDSATVVEKSKIGPILMAMAGRIAEDPVLKDGLVSTTPEIQSHLWEKVTANQQWRDLFKTYVAEELKKEWPEPDDWQRWALRIAEEESAQKKEECQKAIAGLLVHINRLAEAEKQRAMAGRSIAELKRKFAGPSPFPLALKKYAEAVQLLPEVNAFASECPDKIREGKENKRMRPLQEVMSASRDYAENVLWHIPAKGRYAEQRNRLLEQFRRYYYQAKDAYSLLSTAYEQKMLQEAARTEPPQWTAKRYPFTITFEQVQGRARQEYLNTGTADNTKKNIKEAYSKILKQYEKDYDAVDKVAIAAMSTASDSSSRDAFISFSSQWAYYKSADVQAFTELELLMDDYLKALSLIPLKNLETALQGGEGVDGVEQIEQKMQHIKDAGVFTLESEIEKHCLAPDKLPEGGYAAMPELTFSQNPDDAVMKTQTDAGAGVNVDPGLFFGAYVQQAAKIRSRVLDASLAANPCAPGQGTLPLSELISHINRFLAMMETVRELKGEMDEIKRNMSALADFIHLVPMPKNRMPELEAKIDAMQQFMATCKKIEDDVRAMKQIYTDRKSRYLADIHNIEKDLFFLDELHIKLLGLPEIFYAFRGSYAYQAAPAGAWAEDRSFFIFKPGITRPLSCDAAQGKPVLMTQKEIEQAIRKFHETQNLSGTYALDAAYGLTIRKYAENYIRKSLAIGRPYSPENYLYVSVGAECIFFPKEYFDELAKNLAAIPVNALERFNENLHSAFSKTKYYRPEKLFRIPYEKDLSGRRLPAAEKMNLKILTDLETDSRKNWNAPAKASLRKAVAVLKEKQKVYVDWKSKESHFGVVWKKLEQVDKRFSAAESKANAVDIKTVDKPQILELLKAAAMESEILGFETKAGADPGLSEQRRTQILKHISGLKQRLHPIKEMIRNLENPKPAAPGPVPQVPNAAG
jgi:hypothetical protein